MRDSFVPAVIYSTVTFVLAGMAGLGYCTYYFYQRDNDDPRYKYQEVPRIYRQALGDGCAIVYSRLRRVWMSMY